MLYHPPPIETASVFRVGAGVAFVRRTNELSQGLQSLDRTSTRFILLPAGPTSDASLVGPAGRERRKGEPPAHQGLKPLATNARPPGEEHAPIRTAHVGVHPQTLNTYTASAVGESNPRGHGGHRLETGATPHHRLETGATPHHRLETGATPHHRLETGATPHHRLETGSTRRGAPSRPLLPYGPGPRVM
jgi:hypothetical protein